MPNPYPSQNARYNHQLEAAATIRQIAGHLAESKSLSRTPHIKALDYFALALHRIQSDTTLPLTIRMPAYNTLLEVQTIRRHVNYCDAMICGFTVSDFNNLSEFYLKNLTNTSPLPPRRYCQKLPPTNIISPDPKIPDPTIPSEGSWPHPDTPTKSP